jgi:tetratricopeptide (TPR) repeat protein
MRLWELPMKPILLLVPALVAVLSAQDLPSRLQGAQRLRADAVRGLQAELAAAEAPEAGKGYFEAYTAYVLATQLRGKEPAAMEALVDRSLKALETRQDPDSLALTAALLGLKLQARPEQGMTLAPRAAKCFAMARALAPENPRVLLFHGMHLLFMPPFAGGGADKALPELEAAARTADAEAAPKDPWAPAWGKAESHAWLAYALAGAGRMAEARIHCDRSLALDPMYGFARFGVLPKLSEGTK